MTWMRPVIRLLRRKTVLALIFCLSFAYCMTSLYYGHHYRNMHPGSIRSSLMSDYSDIDENGGNIGFRRGIGNTGPRDKDHPVVGAGMIPLLSPHLSDSHDRRVQNLRNDLIDYPDGAATDPAAAAAAHEQVKSSSCRNSVQGKVLIADDRGYICQRKELVPSSGCCDSTISSVSVKRYSCDTCNSGSNCCSIYEYCISCCMHPDRKGLLSAVIHEDAAAGSAGGGESNRIIPSVSQVFYASLTDQFDYCLARCRTSSHSVQHENSYRDPKAKHCYGAVDPPVAGDAAAAAAVVPGPS